jgi:hypothetical protein
MKNARNNTAIAIALFLMFSMVASLAVLPNATAQEPMEVEPFPFINANPNPAQVGTNVLLHVGSVYPLQYVDDYWELSVIITKPDNTTTTIEDVKTDATGGTGVTFTPTMTGTYKLYAHFPEQVAPPEPPFGFQAGPPGNAIMLESDSPVIELVVQEDPISIWPGVPLPTEYWTRPINDQIWEWAPLAGNWLGDQVSMDAWPPAQTLYKDYNDYAPEAAHILWAKPLTMGGIAGGQRGNYNFEYGDAYEPKWTGSVIIGGILFYNEFESTGSESAVLERNVIAVNLHTGEELWHKPLIDLDGNYQNLDFGQVFYWDAFNYHGVFPYLWTSTGGFGQPTTWNAYDAFTGRWEYSMEGIPSGTRIYGPKGEIFIYTVDLNNGWMALWNSSRVVQPQTSGTSNDGSWRPQGNVYDAARTASGYEWNVTIGRDEGVLGERSLPGSVDKIREGIILGTDFDKYLRSDDGTIRIWALSTEAGKEGTLLYNKTFTMPIKAGHYDVQDADVESDVFTVSVAETSQHWGFRLSTGQMLWGPTDPQQYVDKWGYGSSNSWDNIVDGKYISGNYGGTVYCRNVTTGEIIWTYDIDDPYHEVLQNTKIRFRPAFIADGKLYLENTEHNPFNPQHRGFPFLCLDLETGEKIFSIPIRGSEWSSTPIIGDSIIAMYNEYDQRIYAIGKGPSATTVTGPEIAQPMGTPILIKGTVMDISPGTNDAALTMRFPDGVPAVSDDSMSVWMMYVYSQFGRPANATGVEVTLSVLDPNNNVYDIGNATTDSSGTFSLMWDPLVPGKYTVIATFAGSDSFYASSAETSVGITEAPEVTPEPTPIPASVADQYIVPATTGIIIAIVVVGLVIILMLRKR